MNCGFRIGDWRSGGGMTLVELMVATSILAIGMVLVGRALLTASAALASAEHRIQAVQFLEAKMTQLQQQASAEGGVEPGTKTGVTELHHRPATWLLEVVPVQFESPEQPTVRLTEVRLSLSWQEARRKQDVGLVTYLQQRPTP